MNITELHVSWVNVICNGINMTSVTESSFQSASYFNVLSNIAKAHRTFFCTLASCDGTM
jgi:hypothetical protein